MLSLLLVTAFAQRSPAQNDAPDAGTEAIVTLHIDGLDDATWSALTKRVGRESNSNFEYSCLRAGVVVLRMQHLSVTEKGDVITIVRGMLNDSGIRSGVEFLNVHIERQGWGECRQERTGALQRA
jgi:hypothetical protein